MSCRNKLRKPRHEGENPEVLLHPTSVGLWPHVSTFLPVLAMAPPPTHRRYSHWPVTSLERLIQQLPGENRISCCAPSTLSPHRMVRPSWPRAANRRCSSASSTASALAAGLRLDNSAKVKLLCWPSSVSGRLAIYKHLRKCQHGATLWRLHTFQCHCAK
jgi:hypothetical protein